MHTQDLPHPLELLTRRWFDEVWNSARESTIDELFHPAGIAHGLTDDESAALTGPPGFRDFYSRFKSSFSNIHIELHDVFAHNEKAVARFTFTATHTGPGLGIPPTQRQVKATGICITHWSKPPTPQILHAWNEFDTATLLSQLQSPLSTQVLA